MAPIKSLPRAWGVGRLADNDKAIVVHFSRALTDDELRDLHDTLAGRHALNEEPKASSQTPEGHRARHVLLHQAFDELFADFARHAPLDRHGLTDAPLRELMEWSYRQTIHPDEIKR